MKPNLIPAAIVDKNGKTTTVYRKPDRTANHSSIPAPTAHAAKTAPQTHNTPLPVPPPIDPSRLTERLSYFHGIQALSRRKTPSPDELALINSILDRGHIGPEQLGTVSDYMGMMSTGERIKDFDYNTFLLAERYAQNSGSTEIFNYNDMHVFKDAVAGLYQRRRPADITVERITTEEELDANVAILRMVILMSEMGDENLSRTAVTKEYRTATGQRIFGTFLRNQGLAELIRERHESYPEIERYVRDRGAPKNKNEVDALKAYLDNSHEHTTAIAEGWL